MAVEDLPYKSLWHSLGTGATVTNYGSNLEEFSIASYMGRINYGFDNKYLLTLTGRYDGASQLAEGTNGLSSLLQPLAGECPKNHLFKDLEF